MTRATVLTRMLCALALLVAAWPVRASVVECAPLPLTLPKCGMACCAKKAMLDGHADSSSRLGDFARNRKASLAKVKSRKEGCGCEIDQAPAAPRKAERAVLPSLDPPIFIEHFSLPSVEILAVELPVEPGIFGIDSGPPPGASYRSDFGRAPPVVRV